MKNLFNWIKKLFGHKPGKNAKLGWKRDLPDPRDHKFKVVPQIELPKIVDLRNNCPSIYDQGQIGSCFVGSTEIPLINGETRTIKELSEGIEGKEFWIYSILKNKIVPAKATAHKTGINKEIIKVKLDNGNEIKCTPDHKFMLRDGSYKEAQNLQKYDSLMPLKRKTSDRGYELVFENSDTKWHYTHWIVKTQFDKRNGHDLIHHIDFNKLNNSPENLKFMSSYDHMKLHAQLCENSFKDWNGSEKQREHSRKVALSMHKNNPGWNLKAASNGGKTAWKKANNDPEMKSRMLSGLEKGRTNSLIREKAKNNLKKTLSTPEIRKKHSETAKKNMEIHRSNNDSVWNNLISLGKNLGGSNSLKYQIMKFGRKMIDQKININEINWNNFRITQSRPKITSRQRNGKTQKYTYLYNNLPRFNTALKTFGNINNLIDVCHNYNTKVIEVVKLNRSEDVYCLTVPETENFALTAGIFVHNCTANAMGGAFQFEQKKQQIPDFIPSRLFIYYNTRSLEGTINEDAGATLRNTMKTMVNVGVCPEKMWGYNKCFKRKPSDDCYIESQYNQVLEYLRVTHSMYDIRYTLAQGFPVAFGMMLYDSFMSESAARTGKIPMPNLQTESSLGGHAVMLVGYNDTIREFIVRNSWGTNWGDRGYFYLPYDYIELPNLTADYWTIKLVEAPIIEEQIIVEEQSQTVAKPKKTRKNKNTK